MTQRTKGRDYSQELIWASAFIGMIRYSAAFLASDIGKIVGIVSEIITFLLGLSGFAMGILGTFGTAYLFDGWRTKLPSNGDRWSSRFKVLTFFVFSALFGELVILVPFTVSRLEQASMSQVLGLGVWWWSTAVNAMPILLIGGASIGNKIVTLNQTESSGNFPETFQPQKNDEVKVVQWRTLKKKLSNDDLISIIKSTPSALAAKYGMTPKAAKDWPEYAKKELEDRLPSPA